MITKLNYNLESKNFGIPLFMRSQCRKSICPSLFTMEANKHFIDGVSYEKTKYVQGLVILHSADTKQ